MMSMSSVLTLAIVLIVIWVVASVTRFLAGAMLNLLLLAAIVLLLVWGVRKLRG